MVKETKWQNIKITYLCSFIPHSNNLIFNYGLSIFYVKINNFNKLKT